MKVDLTMNSAGFIRHIGFEQAAPAGKTLGQVVWPLLMRAKDWLVAERRPNRQEEAFLAGAQNHADLERRIMMVQNPECQDFFWRS